VPESYYDLPYFDAALAKAKYDWEILSTTQKKNETGNERTKHVTQKP